MRANPKLRSHLGESTSWTPRERAPPPRGEPEGEPTGAPTCFSFALDFRMRPPGTQQEVVPSFEEEPARRTHHLTGGQMFGVRLKPTPAFISTPATPSSAQQLCRPLDVPGLGRCASDAVADHGAHAHDTPRLEKHSRHYPSGAEVST